MGLALTVCMPIAGCKISAPTWDSDNNKPPYLDFVHQMESFVTYQTHGTAIITLCNKIIGKTTATALADASFGLDAAILVQGDELRLRGGHYCKTPFG